MISILQIILRLTLWLLVAPLLPGIINRVKAWVAGRQGPPVLQLYYDLARLWKKSVVLSTLASPAFIAGPAVAWVAVVGAAMLVPLGPAGGGLSFKGDVLLLVYLLAVARFCTAWAALETGSAFEGMGAAREVSYAVLTEAALITAILALSVQTGTVVLDSMLSLSSGPGAVWEYQLSQRRRLRPEWRPEPASVQRAVRRHWLRRLRRWLRPGCAR